MTTCTVGFSAQLCFGVIVKLSFESGSRVWCRCCRAAGRVDYAQAMADHWVSTNNQVIVFLVWCVQVGVLIPDWDGGRGGSKGGE